MSLFAELQREALGFITGFEMKHGRCPSIAEVAHAQLGGDEGLASALVAGLVAEGKLRRGLRSRRRNLQVLRPVPIPRAPDGEPLHFVRIGGIAA
jgi:hypothetical protein